MTPAEKEEVMRSFNANEVQLLVSTTVVEVGVDVPNATLMVIMDADRFGLSQLHQLRGRVGRGQHASYCILIADPKSEVGQERMNVMTETDDGFEVSRRDLDLRGPGDFSERSKAVCRNSGLPTWSATSRCSKKRGTMRPGSWRTASSGRPRRMPDSGTICSRNRYFREIW
ncbi:helicase-related protein [Paenibacillus sp. JTLBN-2024]